MKKFDHVNNYYGVLDKWDNTKCFIVCCEAGKPPLHNLITHDFRPYFSPQPFDSLINLIEEDNDLYIHEFNSEQELLKWLNQRKNID